MFSAVRKAIGQLQQKEDDGKVDADEVTDQMREMLKGKAPIGRVEALEQVKASKTDTELALRWTDLLHSMCKALA